MGQLQPAWYGWGGGRCGERGQRLARAGGERVSRRGRENGGSTRSWGSAGAADGIDEGARGEVDRQWSVDFGNRVDRTDRLSWRSWVSWGARNTHRSPSKPSDLLPPNEQNEIKRSRNASIVPGGANGWRSRGHGGRGRRGRETRTGSPV
jgi:hypothetical protein